MDKLCPLLKKVCMEHQCRWWIHLRGANPQGGEIDHWGCAVEWLPVLLIETSKEVRQSAAATESLRNENVSAAGALVAAIEGVKRIRAG